MTNADDKVSSPSFPSSGESGDGCSAFPGALPEVLQNQEVERSVQQHHNEAILAGNTTGDSDNLDGIKGTTALPVRIPGASLTAEQLNGPEAAEGNTPVSAPSGASAENNSAWASIPANSLNLGKESLSVLMKPSESESIPSETPAANTTGGFLANMSDTTSTDESEQPGGGRPMLEESQRFCSSVMERTRSQAAVDAAVKVSPSVGKPSSMVAFGDGDQDVLRIAVAKKRVRVVQLLAVGLLSFAAGILGSVWAQGSCHFITAVVEYVQEDDATTSYYYEDLHYGLYEVSPDSETAAQGGASCSPYSTINEVDEPIVPRVVGVVALVTGTLAVGVLWIYLIFGKAEINWWKFAVVSAVVAGVSQLSTLLFFAGNVCQSNECSFGPGAIVSIVSSIAFFVLAFEMHYNMAVCTHAAELGTCPLYEKPATLMKNLELADIGYWVKSYRHRLTGDDELQYQYPTLNAFHRKKYNPDNPLGEAMLDQEEGYRSPLIVCL